MKKTKRLIYTVLMFVFAAAFLISSGLLVRDLIRNRRQQQTFDGLSSLFPEETAPPVPSSAAGTDGDSRADLPLKEQMSPSEWKTWWDTQFKLRSSIYQALHRQNSDVIGWIRIEGMKIDYPVCYTPDEPDYYLHRDINKKYSSYGTPYLDGRCTLEEPRSSLLLYGHHMKNGSMFASLENYMDDAWYQAHPYIQFDTLDEPGSYEIAAVVKLDAQGTNLSWQQLLFPASEEEFTRAWQSFQKRNYCSTGTELAYTDELLALVTCEYTQRDGRLMVIAKRIR